jgi:hypothetical protein
MPSSYGILIEYKTREAAEPYGFVADFTRLGQITEAETPKIKKDTYEKKYIDGQTPAERYKQFGGSFVDGGSVAFKTEFEKGKYEAMKAAVESPDTLLFRITLPDARGTAAGARSSIEFEALAEELGLPLDGDGGELIADLTLKVSGKPTFTKGTGTGTPA